ncbi:MAG: serine hydrolase domain-containing protein, partial [Halobacteriaceae archaeon]
MSNSSATIDSETKQHLESYVTEWMGENEIPGASFAVVEGTNLAYVEGYGARNLSENLPATPETLYGFGSCTKSFITAAILQLAESDELSLSDSIDDYVPYLSDVPGEPIELQELMSHTSGMPSDGNLSALITRLTEIGDANIPLTSDDDFRRHVEGSNEERLTDKQRFFYYNTGFTLLGKVIADVT